ncbi:putative bifunctional diguanylate cyclase/phosphodiesterase [Streptomyces pathocidini]|uniref:Bifunctional diguanylate cyclase/phosphodiesterase n=1 Tax=Streptomyces pathocidini TaxID=1650571 RepID=A0ABW7ULZ1_9ACTN|nr:EAL domain-containing protein [Streptomyces pathocidini]
MSAPGTVISRRLFPGGGAGLFPRLVVALICGGYAIGAALGWGSPWLALVMGDFGLGGAALAAAVSCFWYARNSSSRFRPAWLLFAVSSAMAGFGNVVWGWYEVVLRQPVPSPSPADFCFLLFAPPAIVGLLVLAKRPVTRAGWICLALDAWLIGGSLLTISWSLALAHTAQWNGESVAQAALSLAYPLLDIVLVSMVLALHFRRSSANRSAVNTAIAALALTVLCDALFTSPLLREHYRSGQLLDAGWFAGSMLLAYAPWVGRRDTDGWDRAAAAAKYRRGQQSGRPIAGSLAALTPYLAAAVCTLGILYNVVDGRVPDRVVVFTACTVVLALVVRQGIMLLDNISLTQELAQKENHFRSLVQGSSDVIMIAAPSGVLRYVSPAAAGVYGIDPEELVGSELASLIHPDDLGAVVHELRRFLATPPDEESTTRIECRFRAGRGKASGSRTGGGRAGGGRAGDGRAGGGAAAREWLNVESTVNRHHGGLILNSRDVTERVRLQEQLQHNAEHDPLTDLPNRALFTERVRQALSGRRTTDAGTAVLFIDLDGFKAVNDTIGHQAGDELLIHAARRLQESVRAGDTAARLGGDEFAALILGDGSGESAERDNRIHEIADRLRERLSKPYRISGTDVRVAASIGVAFAESGITPTELMRNADLAMYRAKAAGKGRVELYAPRMQAEAVQRASLDTRVKDALDEGEFALLHQPVVDLGSGRIAAVAAQARWRSQQGILFTPAEFLRLGNPSDIPGQSGGSDAGGPQDRDPATGTLPVAHNGSGGNGSGSPHHKDPSGHTGPRTAELGRWLLEEAVAQAAERHQVGHTAPVAVRLSPRRLMGRGMGCRSVEALLTRHGLPSGGLVLELADSDPRIPLGELERRLVALRRLGVRIALDGFGSGGASFGALRRLPVDVLKLDRTLVEGVVESARLHKITAGLLRIAGDLGVHSVADGVDLPEQVDALRAMGCTHGQGMAFSGPLDEHRLRRALGVGEYPVPAPADAMGSSGAAYPNATSGPPEDDHGAARKAVLASRGSLPPRLCGAAAPESLGHPPTCPNNETPVPPT